MLAQARLRLRLKTHKARALINQRPFLSHRELMVIRRL